MKKQDRGQEGEETEKSEGGSVIIATLQRMELKKWRRTEYRTGK